MGYPLPLPAAPVVPVFETLTERERQVLFWCCHGKTASEMALLLRCATSTVNFHMNNLHAKFGITSTTYIAAISAARGLVPIEVPQHLAPAKGLRA
ncbi:LuxR C-terminal-related transcriptional regulator [Pseudomonas sp. NPDC007930]|uniref:helix-turn-helix domain-containing protein n=1 Tax=Pseudomonas sp. NPDC007930 TaxID=3364417 RepID=UPI0036EEEC7A